MTDEQRMLQESLNRLLAAEYDLRARQAASDTAQGWSEAIWARFAELGLPALGLPEDHGGFGGPAEIAIAFEALGRAMSLEPLLASTVLGGTALARAGSPAQCARLLPEVAAGTLRLAFAPRAGAARDTAQGWRLDGAAKAVLHGDSAQLLVIGAGDGLFLVDAEAPGLRRAAGRLRDGTRIADLTLDDVPAERLPGDAAAAIEAAEAAGLAAVLHAEVGAMAAALDLTVEYLKTRKQFGRAIGSNQALQHRAADMLVALEEARSMAAFATATLAEPDPARRALDLSRARIIVSRSARTVGQGAVQLHGGIGMTEAYAAGHYLRHLTVAGHLFGDTEHHLARLEAAGALA
jgi:alkylation response protein AidB-like acyl-CoA dehydrogenase